MTVLLRTTRDLGRLPQAMPWVAIPDVDTDRLSATLDPTLARCNVGGMLESAFDQEAQSWWTLGRDLSGEPSSILAHTPACAANASDFGQMLAWTRLVRGWAAEPDATLVVCDDPWLFRHMRQIANVDAGRPPLLWPLVIGHRIRGYVARLCAALAFAAAALRLRAQSRRIPADGCVLLVYGHPSSTAAGVDGYFGDLMQRLPGIRRMLHVDCRPARARALAADGRTNSLHAFGSPVRALLLPFARWRPARRQLDGNYRWLVRRSASREGATAQAAAIRWQLHCQERWLRRCRPAVVAWPWENHSWERDFVRTARRLGVQTVGYQHSVIGRQMLNYASMSNPDGEASVPDRVFCTGQATCDRLAAWGIDRARLAVAGALRFDRPQRPAHDPAAPAFVALPFDARVAGEMVAAIRSCAARGRRFQVKDHPMTPYDFAESEGVSRTDKSLGAHRAVSAVIYAATTVGLEAAIAGLPTLRFQPRGRIALDILPDSVHVPAADSESLCGALDRLAPPPPVDAAAVFAPVDEGLWRSALASC